MQIERGFAGGVAAALPIHLVAVTYVEHAAVVRLDGRESIVLHCSTPPLQYFSPGTKVFLGPCTHWPKALMRRGFAAPVELFYGGSSGTSGGFTARIPAIAYRQSVRAYPAQETNHVRENRNCSRPLGRHRFERAGRAEDVQPCLRRVRPARSHRPGPVRRGIRRHSGGGAARP